MPPCDQPTQPTCARLIRRRPAPRPATPARPASAPASGALWSFEGPYRVLHLTWFAFFLSFVVWFNFAPFSKTIGDQLHLSKAQLVTLGLCNVALTVPARVFVGMALDRFGPRRTYSAILVYAVVPCTLFATAQLVRDAGREPAAARHRRRRLRGRHPHGVGVVPARRARHRRGRLRRLGQLRRLGRRLRPAGPRRLVRRSRTAGAGPSPHRR